MHQSNILITINLSNRSNPPIKNRKWPKQKVDSLQHHQYFWVINRNQNQNQNRSLNQNQDQYQSLILFALLNRKI